MSINILKELKIILIKIKYAITKFWWWNLKITFETILEWENLSAKKSLSEKKWESFSKSLEILNKK